MENIKGIWIGLAPTRRIAILATSAAMFLAVMLFSQMGGRGPSGLLYSGLAPSAAGDVVAALEARGAPYEIRGTSIYVDEADRDRLRMTLAGEGLPALGEKGYELLDNLSGFGTTSQMFDAAYWRAKEGELARTIVAAPHIESARVHISAAVSRSFQNAVAPSAAVTVGTVGGGLSQDQARALRFLIAASVSGMSPQDVAVIDKVSGLIASGEGSDAQGGEDPRVEALRAKVSRLMEARVGYGNAVVELSIETVTESAHITERRFDPEGRVAISSSLQERSSENENSGGGQVTVASNLPDSEAGEGTSGSASKTVETHETTNFEVSETTREISKGPGDIRRLTVAVLINDAVSEGADGETVYASRSPEELGVLRSLVETAVGYDADRGDIITLQSMPFEPVSDAGASAYAGAGILASLNVMQLAQYLIFAAVSIVFAIFVLRPLAASKGVPAAISMMDESGDSVSMEMEPPSLIGSSLPELEFAPAPEIGALEPIAGLGGAELASNSPADRLQALLSDRQGEVLQVLQNWLQEPTSPTEGV